MLLKIIVLFYKKKKKKTEITANMMNNCNQDSCHYFHHLPRNCETEFDLKEPCHI